MVENTQDAARRLREQDAKPDADVPAYCYPNAKPLADGDWYFDPRTHHHPYGNSLTDPHGVPDRFTFAEPHAASLPNTPGADNLPDTYSNRIHYAAANSYGSTPLQWWRLLGQPTRRQL